MNPDYWKNHKTLGSDRPFIQGGIYFKTHKVWNKEIFNDLLGQNDNKVWNKFSSTKEYQKINFDQLRQRYVLFDYVKECLIST